VVTVAFVERAFDTPRWEGLLITSMSLFAFGALIATLGLTFAMNTTRGYAHGGRSGGDEDMRFATVVYLGIIFLAGVVTLLIYAYANLL